MTEMRYGYRDMGFWANLPQPLPREKQAQLFAELRDDNTTENRRQTIRDTLCLHNLRIVQQQASKLTHTPETAEVVFSAGVCGLLKAIDRVRLENVEQWHPYATQWVRGEIVKALYTEAGLREKQGADATRWKRWSKDTPGATPEQAVEDGVFKTVAQAYAARSNAILTMSVTAVEEACGTEFVEGLPKVGGEPEDRQLERTEALKTLTELVDPVDLEILLTWASNGCPPKQTDQVKNALQRARNAAEHRGIQIPLFGSEVA